MKKKVKYKLNKKKVLAVVLLTISFFVSITYGRYIYNGLKNYYLSSKNFYFPCVIGDEIYAAKYIPSEPFITGKYGIMEPAGERICDCSFLDFIFVPALAVDYSGNRLGYGKGYYDRFLSGYPSVVTAAAVFNELCFEKIPAENHDVKIKYIITENKFYDVR